MDQRERYKTRMRFTKTGSVRFLGHLDLMRFFQKAVRRAGLRVAYSQGYSPHQLMSFAAPLSVGATTDGDYMDVEFGPGKDGSIFESPLLNDSGVSESDAIVEYDVADELKAVMDRLNQCLTDEIFITDIRRMPPEFKNSMSMLRESAYMITAKGEGGFPEDYQRRFDEFMLQDAIWITKKTKKSEKQINLKAAIKAYAYTRGEFEEMIGEALPELHPVYEGDSIFLKLPSDSAETVKPEIVMEEYFRYCEFTPEPWGYQIHRCQMWFT